MPCRILKSGSLRDLACTLVEHLRYRDNSVHQTTQMVNLQSLCGVGLVLIEQRRGRLLELWTNSEQQAGIIHVQGVGLHVADHGHVRGLHRSALAGQEILQDRIHLLGDCRPVYRAV